MPLPVRSQPHFLQHPALPFLCFYLLPHSLCSVTGTMDYWAFHPKPSFFRAETRQKRQGTDGRFQRNGSPPQSRIRVMEVGGLNLRLSNPVLSFIYPAWSNSKPENRGGKHVHCGIASVIQSHASSQAGKKWNQKQMTCSPRQWMSALFLRSLNDDVFSCFIFLGFRWALGWEMK